MKKLLFPEDLQPSLVTRFKNQVADWLTTGGVWPKIFSLGLPNEKYALDNSSMFDKWVLAWKIFQDKYDFCPVKFKVCKWKISGEHNLPEKLICNSPHEFVYLIGKASYWQRLVMRKDIIVNHWPNLLPVLKHHLEFIARIDDDEFNRCIDVLVWLSNNPQSNMYIRQLPIPGISTKWMENRIRWIFDCLPIIQSISQDEYTDIYDLCGLRRLPEIIRMRILDSEISTLFNGINHLEISRNDFLSLDWPVTSVLIVENLQSALAIEKQLPGLVVIMACGYGLDILKEVPWMQNLKIGYWGDLDTHGFAMLHRFRAYYPNTQSLMMNEETMIEHKQLWGNEDKPSPAETLSFLDNEEQGVYEKFRHEWKGLRLEQERIDWQYAVQQIIKWHSL